MDNTKLPINQLIAKLNKAAENNEPMDLSVDEVKLMAKNFGNLVMIPVYNMNNFPIKKHKKNEDVDTTKE